MCYPFLPVHCGEPGRHCAILERGARRGSPSSSGCGRLETGTVASILRPPGKTVRGKAKTPWLAEQRNEKNGVSEKGGGSELTGRVALGAGRGGKAGWLRVPRPGFEARPKAGTVCGPMAQVYLFLKSLRVLHVPSANSMLT